LNSDNLHKVSTLIFAEESVRVMASVVGARTCTLFDLAHVVGLHVGLHVGQHTRRTTRGTTRRTTRRPTRRTTRRTTRTLQLTSRYRVYKF
jgi:hypothetical protein